jgi:hypothetical protein
MSSPLDSRSSRSRRAWVCWSIGAGAVPLAAAVVLCAWGLSAIVADYDGMLSALNPVTVGTCCGAVLLVIVAALTWLLLAAKSTHRRR